MRCSTVRKLLDDQVDGVLAADVADRLRRHLDSCPDCEQEAELLRSVTTPLSAWGDLQPPADCFDRILERIVALPPHMHSPGSRPVPLRMRLLRGGARWLVTSGAVAAAVLAAAVTIEAPGAAAETPRRRVATEAASSRAPNRLGRGEAPLARTRFVLTDEFEQRDGLGRESLGRENLGRESLGRGDSGRDPSRHDRARPPALPVSLDPLGTSTR